MNRLLVRLAAFALGTTLCALTGCNRKESGSTTPPSTPAGGGPAASAQDQTPRFSLTSGQFYAEIRNDRKAAKAKFDGVPIEVAGVVTGIHTNADGEPFVLVWGSPTGGLPEYPSMAMVGLPCFTREMEPWARAARGQVVKVRGRAEMEDLPRLVDCEFTDLGAPVVIAVTAEQLAGEYARDREGTMRKYTLKGFEGKPLIVTGEIAEKWNDDSAAPAGLFLKGGQGRVTCSFSTGVKEDTAVLAGLKPGQTVKVYGEFEVEVEGETPPPPPGRDRLATLRMCKLITQ